MLAELWRRSFVLGPHPVEAQRKAERRQRAFGPFLDDAERERLLRDAPLMCIGEGTNEMQRIIIARQLVQRNPV